MKSLLAVSAACLAAIALAGCSSPQNEAPCKDFEAMYNAVDLRDKLITIDERGKDYRPSLKKLADTARAGADKATGDVKENLAAYVMNAERYEKTETTLDDLPYNYLDVRAWLEDARNKLVESCKASSYPIELEPDHPVR